MTRAAMFGQAVWLGAPAGKPCGILRRRFRLDGVAPTKLRIAGLGYFHAYLNGVRISDDLFLPLATDYCPRENYPTGETLTGHRLYVPEYDVTALLRPGENVLTIHFGGGWYTWSKNRYGEACVIWRLSGGVELCSSAEDRMGESFVSSTHFTQGEVHDYAAVSTDALGADFDDRAWPNALPVDGPETDYLVSACPPDRVCETVAPIALGGGRYDCGKNLTGYPVLRLTASAGETVTVTFAEERLASGELDPNYIHRQTLTLVSDGKTRTVRPAFTWYGFRHFDVVGGAEVLCVEHIHTDVAQTGRFESDCALLNWLHDTFVHTQLTNMHGGLPSDCPHLERRGYTGDGQLVCHAAMTVLDGRDFYAKWIADIGDCQDIHTGHVQYTAPYVKSGGGPGGWGCAIVEVPYQFYRHYGETDPLARYYPQMRRYFDYLDAHSYGDLVIADKEGEWCLGDWCPPMQVVLPAPFVNTYFYVKSLGRMIEIARLCGHEADIPGYEAKREACKSAMMACYFNKWDGNFVGMLQGANAFAVDIGLGDARTYPNLVAYYEKLGHLDTGIFGTDLVIRTLFEHGDGQLATRLLCATDIHSFAGMRARGATTLHEYWPQSLRDRSHNHPMFGAVVAYLYDYLLGIRAETAGYGEIVIAPCLVDEIGRLSGARALPRGEVAVAYTKTDDAVEFCVTVPDGVEARFVLGEVERVLDAGENRFTLPR